MYKGGDFYETIDFLLFACCCCFGLFSGLTENEERVLPFYSLPQGPTLKFISIRSEQNRTSS